MSKLKGRKTKAVFETGNAVYERRRQRPIIVELKPDYMLLRLKGKRAIYHLSYTSALNQAIRNAIIHKKLEKAKEKASGSIKRRV